MAKLLLEIDVPDDVDPLRVDPHEVAESIVDYANEGFRANGEPTVGWSEAEWAP